MAMLILGTERNQTNRLQDSAINTCQKAHAHEETTANTFTTLKRKAVAKKDAEEDVVAVKGENRTHPKMHKNRLASTVGK